MKIRTIVILIVIVMSLCLSANAEVVFRLNFNSLPVTKGENYTLGPSDTLTTVTIHVTQSPLGSARDYGLMPPDPGSPTGHYPSIVTPSSAGFEGGNAFFTCLGNGSDSQQHIGYYISKGPLFSMSGDFTAEAIFMVEKIGTIADPVVDCEFSLQDIFGTAMIDNGGANWEIRVWPIGILGGDGKLQLCLNGNGGQPETLINGPIITPHQWYHIAFVYTAASNTAEFFVDGTSKGTINPNWGGNSTMNDWWIGAWPSNGANRGMAGWIDAIAISNMVRTPSTFSLPRLGYTGVHDWEVY